jgi:hypothetical protein
MPLSNDQPKTKLVWTVEKFALLQAAVDAAGITVDEAAFLILNTSRNLSGKLICPCGHTVFLRTGENNGEIQTHSDETRAENSAM